MTSQFKRLNIFVYSLILSAISQLLIAFMGVFYSRYVNDLSASEFPITKMFDESLKTAYISGFIQSTLFIFLYWLLIRWISSTAEKAGRSYSAFMVFAIFLPIIAWLVVITFKKSDSNQGTSSS